MGKLKKRSRSSNHRANPVAQNKRVKEDKQNETLRTNKVLPLITNLSASAPNDRSMALGSISVLAEDPTFRKLLLKEKLLQILMEQSLKDSNDEIIVESFGLLRNLVIEEGYDVAIYLWRQNIWKEIESNLEKAKVSFDGLVKGDGKNGKVETALLFDYLENLISLIVGLGDSADLLFEQIFEKIDPIVGFLKKILEYAVDYEKKTLRTSINLFNAVLDLIYNFSTQSLDFTQSLISQWEFNFEVLDQFVKDTPRCNELSRVYMKGIMLQLLDLNTTVNKDSSLLHSLEQIVFIIKDIDIDANRAVLLKEVDNANVENLNIDSKKRVESRSKFQSIELSVELITAAIEYAAFEGGSEEGNITKEFENLLEFLTGTILEALLSLLSYSEFRQSALTALNNLSWLFVKIGANIEVSISSKIWQSVLKLKDVEIEEKVHIFGVLWALATSNAGSEIQIDEPFINEVISDFQKTVDDPEVDSELKDEYLTRLVGFLGTIAKRQGSIERNLKISKFFIQQLDSLPKLSSVLAIEILDMFYEIYGDSEFDYDGPVFVNEGYLSTLEELTPAVKTAVKLIDKNKNPGLKLKAEEVFNNLGRFIQYKRSEAK
jgi:hypothetical protein